MSPDKRPVRLRVGPATFYLLFGVKNVQLIFRSSKVLGKEKLGGMIFRSCGMNERDLAIILADDSGTAREPFHPRPEALRIHKITHDLGTSDLASGSSVNLLTSKFVQFFAEQLDKEPLGKQSTVQIARWLRQAMFLASTASLAGTEILRVNPDDLPEIYEGFEAAFGMMVTGLPRFLYSNGHRARDRFLECNKRWIDAAWKNFDENDADKEWEERFGSSYMRGQVHAFKDAGVSQHGQAAGMMILIWA